MKHTLIFTCILGMIFSCEQLEKSNLLLLDSNLPGDSARVFAPGIISTESFEFAITFSPTMEELFFTRRKPEASNEIYTMRLEEGAWSAPELAFFKPDAGWDFEPHISPDGQSLYYGSVRPHPDTLKPRGLYQWVSQKTDDSWSEPFPLDQPFADRFVMYISASAGGTLYFTSEQDGDRSTEGIYYAVNEGGLYSTVERMGPEINLPGGESIAHPYIAPDESYLIYDGTMAGGFGDCDLYISFNRNGTWTRAQNLGPRVNTDRCEMCASVSPDQKFLFFHRGVYEEGEENSGNIYWIGLEDFLAMEPSDATGS